MPHKNISPNTGIKLIDVVLIKSVLQLKDDILGEDNMRFSSPNLSLNVGYKKRNGNSLLARVNIICEVLTSQGELVVKIEVEKAALFSFDKDIEETLQENNIPSIEQFISVNAASIIYSYIRQHIMDLSLKARIGPIILPVVNFVKLKEDS